MTRSSSRILGLAALGLAALLGPGCGEREVETTYGRSAGPSINGTRALAEMFRASGHKVRVAFRFVDLARGDPDTLIRFAPTPGPPELEEGRKLHDWLRAGPGRKVVYVPRDFSAEPGFWVAVRAAQPKDAKAEVIGRIEARRNASRGWANDLPARPAKVAPAAQWFATSPPPKEPMIVQVLEGPWAEGVDARLAAVTRHDGLRAEDGEDVVLAGDGTPLAMTWTLDNGGAALALANASFLLNATLLDRARRPLAARVVAWVGPGPRRIAFLEGDDVLSEGAPVRPSPLALLRVEPFGWVAGHLGAFGILAALATAATLGRPRDRPAPGADRPSSHPEALGALLGRTGRADVALELLDAYRRWRHPASAGPPRPQPGPATLPQDRAPRA